MFMIIKIIVNNFEKQRMTFLNENCSFFYVNVPNDLFLINLIYLKLLIKLNNFRVIIRNNDFISNIKDSCNI